MEAKTETRKLVNAWIDPRDAERLEDAARAADRSRSAELRIAIREYLERPGAARADLVLTSTGRRDQSELAAFHLDRGRRFFEREDDRSALTELHRAIYLSPYQAEAHLLVGRLYLRTGRTKDAIDALKMALWSEETPAAHVALGEAFLQARDPDAARKEAERALELAPGLTGATELLARVRGAPAASPQ